VADEPAVGGKLRAARPPDRAQDQSHLDAKYFIDSEVYKLPVL
jgi:hypothetical protein